MTFLSNWLGAFTTLASATSPFESPVSAMNHAPRARGSLGTRLCKRAVHFVHNGSDETHVTSRVPNWRCQATMLRTLIRIGIRYVQK